VLEGSVRKVGNRVRITVQLVSSSDGGHVWSERFDRELTDVFALEDEIAQAVAERLQVALGRGERVGRSPSIDVEAHTAYLEGRHHLAKGTPQALRLAHQCFERAIARDPDFALAFDSLAELYWYFGFFGGLLPKDAFSQGTWYALRALELDDSLAETHALLAMLRKELDYSWPEVERELQRARELNGESPTVRLRHAISGPLPHGRIEEGIVEVERVLQSDPLSIFVRWWHAVFLYLGRRPDRMIEEGRRMLALDPNHFLGHWVVGVGYTEAEDPGRAVAALTLSHELSGGAHFTRGFLAFALGRSGRAEEARHLIDEAETLAAEAYVSPFTIAISHSGIGDWDSAFSWWSRAVDVRDPLIVPIKTLPIFDPVRDDPRYSVLLRRMNLAER
jgi:tetratricopeptide (TPR) repeat protein